MNVANNLIGSGILSLPFALSQTSVGAGSLLMVAVAALSTYTMQLQCRSCDRCGTFDYRRVAEEALGRACGTGVELVMALYTLGTCMSYSVLVGDFFTRIVEFACSGGDGGGGPGASPLPPTCSFFESRPNAVFVLGAAVLLPVSSLRELSALRYTSLVALVTVLYTVGVVVYKYLFTWSGGHLVLKPHTAPDVRWWAPAEGGVFVSLALMGVAFNCHYNIPRYYRELGPRQRHRMAPSFTCGVGIALSLYLIIAAGGYLTFGGKTLPDVLSDYGTDDLLATLARGALGVTLLFSYPLVFNKLRFSVHSLLFPGRDVDLRAVVAYALVLNPLVFAVGAYVTDLSVVLSFNGALNGTLICYIIPSALYLRLDGFHPKKEGVRFLARAPLWCIFVGLVLMVLGTKEAICKHADVFGIPTDTPGGFC